MKHTHRTEFVRSDFELAALHVLIAFNGQEPTPAAIESWEGRFRGNPEFETSLRRAADKIQLIAPDFKATAHECKGQMCDQDGAFKVTKL
jgi:hypothetical protein